MISARTRDGPLAQSIVALAERSATRATHGAMTAMLAGCDPQNPNCLDHRVSDLSTRAAVAFVDGVKQSLRSVALAVAFLAGAATMLLLGALWRLARRTTDPAARAATSAGERPSNRPPGCARARVDIASIDRSALAMSASLTFPSRPAAGSPDCAPQSASPRRFDNREALVDGVLQIRARRGARAPAT